MTLIKNIVALRKKKLFTICFNHLLEMIQFENSNRGLLLWVNTPKTVRVFRYWKQGGCGGSKKFYQSQNNNHCSCCQHHTGLRRPRRSPESTVQAPAASRPTLMRCTGRKERKMSINTFVPY